jgi:hypothetical protein
MVQFGRKWAGVLVRSTKQVSHRVLHGSRQGACSMKTTGALAARGRSRPWCRAVGQIPRVRASAERARRWSS